MFAWFLAAVSIGIGYPIVMRLDRDDRLDTVAVSVVSGLVGSMLVFFAVWAVGANSLTKTSMSVLAVVLFLGAIPGWLKWKDAFGPVSAETLDKISFLDAAVLATIVVLVLGLVVGAFAPPVDGDPVKYHLLLPRRDIEAGQIQAIYGWSFFDFYPAAIETLYRFGMALTGTRVAHHIHVSFAIATALLIWSIARQIELPVRQANLAVALFLSMRVVMYQPATGDIDQSLTAACAALVLLFLLWQKHASWRYAVLLGLDCGLALNIKYTAIVFCAGLGVVILVSAIRDRTRLGHVALFGLTASVCILPLLLRNFSVTGNPVFPLFNHLFGEGRLNLLGGAAEYYGRGRDLLGFILAPLNVFLYPSYFDGLQFGSVLILAFLPFAVLGGHREPARTSLWVILAIYFAAWFWLLPQQVRFLQPVFPILAVLTAIGMVNAFQVVEPFASARRMLIALVGLLIANQAMFFAGTTIRRWPVALGIASEDSFITGPHFRNNTRLAACRYIEKNLEPDERYISLLRIPSLYCPQRPVFVDVDETGKGDPYADAPRPPISGGELAEILSKNNIRFVLDYLPAPDRGSRSTGEQKRPPHVFQTLQFSHSRLAEQFKGIHREIDPEFVGATARVYDARAIAQYLMNSR